MKFWTFSTLCTVSLLILSGCANPTPSQETRIDSSLPMVKLTQNGVIVDMKTVAFEWNSMQDPRVEGIYVYKQDVNPDNENGLEQYATIKNRFQTHYLDQKVKPGSRYNYSFRTFSKDAQGVESPVAEVNTLPVLDSVSWIHSITGMPRSAKIIWRPHLNHRVYSYVIERKTLEDDSWSKLATLKGRLNAEFIDEKLKDNYVYQYRIKVVTYDDIVSAPSQIVKVVTKALPQTVHNISATTNLPQKIKIDWEKTTQEDFSQYYLYRSKNIDGSYELVKKLKTNTFVNDVAEDGKSYFYRVSVVDKDGLESEHEKNSIQGMTLIKPSAPAIVEAKIVGSNIELKWSKVDSRSASYIVSKTHKKGWFDKTSEEYEGIKVQQFSDRNIVSDSLYTYTIYSVDKDNIKSDPSIEISVNTPESTELEKATTKRTQQEVQVAPKRDEVQEIISPMENLDLNEI